MHLIPFECVPPWIQRSLWLAWLFPLRRPSVVYKLTPLPWSHFLLPLPCPLGSTPVLSVHTWKLCHIPDCFSFKVFNTKIHFTDWNVHSSLFLHPYSSWNLPGIILTKPAFLPPKFLLLACLTSWCTYLHLGFHWPVDSRLHPRCASPIVGMLGHGFVSRVLSLDSWTILGRLTSLYWLSLGR